MYNIDKILGKIHIISQVELRKVLKNKGFFKIIYLKIYMV